MLINVVSIVNGAEKATQNWAENRPCNDSEIHHPKCHKHATISPNNSRSNYGEVSMLISYNVMIYIYIYIHIYIYIYS